MINFDPLNSKINTYVISSNTLSNVESALVSFGATLGEDEIHKIRFNISTATGVFSNQGYMGTIKKYGTSSRYTVEVQNCAYNGKGKIITGNYYEGSWNWDSVNDHIATNSISINNAEIYNSDYVKSALGRLSKIGDLVIMNVVFAVKEGVTLTTSTTLLTIPSAYRPSSNIDCNGVFGDEAIYGQVKSTGSVIQNNWPSKSVVSDTIMTLNANWKV